MWKPVKCRNDNKGRVKRSFQISKYWQKWYHYYYKQGAWNLYFSSLLNPSDYG